MFPSFPAYTLELKLLLLEREGHISRSTLNAWNNSWEKQGRKCQVFKMRDPDIKQKTPSSAHCSLKTFRAPVDAPQKDSVQRREITKDRI